MKATDYTKAKELLNKYSKNETALRHATPDQAVIVRKIDSRQSNPQVTSVKEFCDTLIKFRMQKIAYNMPEQGYSMGGEKQAADFLRKTGATIEIKFSHNGKHFDNDKQTRDIYKVTISKGKRSYTFDFGQSIAKSGLMLQMGKKQISIELPASHKHLMLKKNETALRYWIKNHIAFDILPSDKITYPEQPTNYDVLACLQKYDIGSFEYFCNEFGYDTDSRAAEKVYNAVREEWLNVCRIWSDSEIEELREIE